MASNADIYTAVVALVTGQEDGAYVVALDDFDFDRQPADLIDRSFRVNLNRDGTLGQLGPAHIEEYALDIWIARRPQGNYSAIRTVLADLLYTLECALYDYPQLFNVLEEGVVTEIAPAADDADFVIAHLGLRIDTDRALGSICNP